MKKLILAACIVTLILSGSVSQAQKKEPIPDEASWQLVSNRNDKSKVTVQFYTKQGELMYEETLRNVKLNLSKKKTIRKLNAVLKLVHESWVGNRSKTTETHLVAKRLIP